MNSFTVYYNRYSELLKELEYRTEEDMGYFYIAEFKENLVKIGCTKHPYSRMEQLAYTLERELSCPMKRVAVSGQCKYFRKYEATMHQEFEKERIEGRELFNISFDEALNKGVCLIEQINKTRDEERFAIKEDAGLRDAIKLIVMMRKFGPETKEHMQSMAIAFMEGMATQKALTKTEV